MAEMITVSALNRYVRSLLDSDRFLSGIALKGEIANFVHHYKSGHFYFSLRDDSASVKAVMFRQDARRLAFTPQEGMRVIVRCRVSLYENTGAFQIYVQDMFPDGIGAAQMAFEQLKARLEQEGLFRPEAKQPIPACPRCIGVVTSETGAALQDIRNVLSRRWPLTRLLLAPVNVQGDQAAAQIARGIQILDRSGKVDVIIVARGGGSREDLWVFNDEGIARAAYGCKTPLISAVGHEIDFTILDFVADLRAPTPSAAAELATPDRREMMAKLMNISDNIHKNMQTKLEMCYNRFDPLAERWESLTPGSLCSARAARLNEQEQFLHGKMEQIYQDRMLSMQHAIQLAHSLSPYTVLARGYAIPRSAKGNAITLNQVTPGDRILLTGDKVSVGCLVEHVHEIEGEQNEKTQKF